MAFCLEARPRHQHAPGCLHERGAARLDLWTASKALEWTVGLLRKGYMCICIYIHTQIYIYINTYTLYRLQTRNTYTHTYVLTYVRTYTHACMHACTHARRHAGTQARRHACTQARMHACTQARMHACTQARMRACVYRGQLQSLYKVPQLPGPSLSSNVALDSRLDAQPKTACNCAVHQNWVGQVHKEAKY